MFAKVYLATSIDGYIAGPNHELDWLDDVPNPDGSDFGFAEHMAAMDVIVMGRGTFEAVQAFEPWPYDIPVVVVTSSLSEVPAALEERVQLMTGSPSGVVAQCESQGYENLYVDGGRLVTSFLAEDLIDEMTISVVPVLLGGGIRLFGELPRLRWWTHVHTTAYAGGMVQSTYRRTAET